MKINNLEIKQNINPIVLYFVYCVLIANNVEIDNSLLVTCSLSRRNGSIITFSLSRLMLGNPFNFRVSYHDGNDRWDASSDIEFSQINELFEKFIPYVENTIVSSI